MTDIISIVKNRNLYQLLSKPNDIEFLRHHPCLEVIANSKVFVTIPIDKLSEHDVDHSLEELLKLVSMLKLNDFIELESRKSTSIFNRYPLYLSNQVNQVELSGDFDIDEYEVSVSIQLEKLKNSNNFGVIVKFSHEAEIESLKLDDMYMSKIDQEVDLEVMSSGSMTFDKYLSYKRNDDLIVKIDSSDDELSRIVTIIEAFVDQCVTNLF